MSLVGTVILRAAVAWAVVVTICGVSIMADSLSRMGRGVYPSCVGPATKKVMAQTREVEDFADVGSRRLGFVFRLLFLLDFSGEFFALLGDGEERSAVMDARGHGRPFPGIGRAF